MALGRTLLGDAEVLLTLAEEETGVLDCRVVVFAEEVFAVADELLLLTSVLLACTELVPSTH